MGSESAVEHPTAAGEHGGGEHEGPSGRAIRLMCERSAGACDVGRVPDEISRPARRLHRAPIPYTLEGESRLLDDTSPAAIVYDSATAAPAGIGNVPAMVRAALRGDPTRSSGRPGSWAR